MAIYRGSRYENTIVYNHVHNRNTRTTLERTRMLPTLRRRNIEKVPSFEGTIHTWTESDRIDSLAYRHYGDASKGWLILDSNPQYLTPWDIKPGDTLVIPSYREVQQGMSRL